MRNSIFKTGGALAEENTAAYIERQADGEALTHLRAMHYLLITEPRQQGKTSLIARLSRHSGSYGFRFGYIDLEDLASSMNEGAWFEVLWDELMQSIGSVFADMILPAPRNCRDWLNRLYLLARAAEEQSSQIVIAFDEVGAMAKANWAESFFVSLRKFYNQRAFTRPQCRRVTFVLSGAFLPRDLITDETISPFNVAQRVHIMDFTLEQVGELVAKGAWNSEQANALAKRAHYWTDGQPYLTQSILSYLNEDATPNDVDTIVERLRREDDNHLFPILRRLNAEALLREYVAKILSGQEIRFYPQEHPRQAQLALLGVIKADEKGYCKIRNRIYEMALKELDSPAKAEASLHSIQRELAETRNNLRLIQERKAEYLPSTDIPLKLIKEERRLLERITELEQQLGA